MFRQHRSQGTPGQFAMTGFPTTGPAHAAGFTDRVWREIVVEKEFFLPRSIKAIDELLIIGRAERGNTQRLCFAAREQSRPVSPWQNAGFRYNWPLFSQNKSEAASVPLEALCRMDSRE